MHLGRRGAPRDLLLTAGRRRRLPLPLRTLPLRTLRVRSLRLRSLRVRSLGVGSLWVRSLGVRGTGRGGVALGRRPVRRWGLVLGCTRRTRSLALCGRLRQAVRRALALRVGHRGRAPEVELLLWPARRLLLLLRGRRCGRLLFRLGCGLALDAGDTGIGLRLGYGERLRVLAKTRRWRRRRWGAPLTRRLVQGRTLGLRIVSQCEAP